MTNSSADDESETETSWTRESHQKKTYKNSIPSKVAQKKEPLCEGTFSIPKPELKVSNYSKNSVAKMPQPTASNVDLSKKNRKLLNYSTVKHTKIARSKSEVDFSTETSSSDVLAKLTSQSSFSNDHVDHINIADAPELLRYKKYEKIQKNSPQMSQPAPRHHLIDIVPKPQSTHDWNIPDQTIGIPIASPPNMQHHMKIAPSKPWNEHNFSGHIPTIIHHPLVSGHIPPTYHVPTEQRKKMPLPLPLEHAPLHQTNIYSSILSSSSLSPQQQQTSNSRKENGEKNKVKFSNTVTVAVVPVSQGLI